MAAPNRVIASGSRYNQLFLMDDDGRLTGSTASAPSEGATGSPTLHIKGWKSGSPTVNEPESEVITGDDGRLGEFDYASIGERRFTIDVAINNLALNALLQGTNVETLGGIKMGSLDILELNDINCGFIIQGAAKKYDSGSVGQSAWEGRIIPLATAQPLGRVDYNERTGGVYRFSVTPQVADRNPWGITIADANAGTNGASYREFTSDNPVALHTYRAPGAVDTFSLQHVPVDVASTYVVTRIPGGGYVVATVNSVDTSAKTFTLSSAPVQGSEVHVLYQFQSFVE